MAAMATKMADDSDPEELGRLHAELAAARDTIRALEHASEGEPTGERPALTSAGESLADAIVAGAQDAMVVADEAGRCVEANPAALALFGRSRDELLGSRLAELGDLGRGAFEAEWRTFLETGRIDGTLRVGAGDEVRLADLRGVASIAPGRHLWVLRDMTEDRGLTQRQAQSARLESMGRLAGGVAHDFNNYLSVIIGFGCFLQEEIPETDDKREDVDEILDAAGRARELVQQLLAFSRRQVLSPRSTPVLGLLEKVAATAEPLLGDGVQLSLASKTDSGVVHVDAAQLEQAMVQLVENAADAMPNGGTITLDARIQRIGDGSSLSNALEPGAYAVLEVRDEGRPMSAEACRRAFEPFFFKGKAKKIGLRLSTVYGIVKQSDGHIEVESHGDEGTCFRVYLPLVDRPGSEPTVRAKRDSEM